MQIASFLFSISLALVATMAQATEEAVGKIGYMNGALVAQRLDGVVKVLAPKSEVFAGDLLITAKGSYAQVILKDGTQMTLRPDSNLRIEAFQFNQDAPQTDNAVMRLLKGGFRTVTGLIGKRGNPDAYKMRASTATIGIRGTDYSARLCATKDCLDDDKTKQTPQLVATESNAGDAGLYVTTHDGQVILAQGANTLALSSGESGFTNEKLLTRLTTTPAFMGGDPKMDPAGSGLKDSKSGGISEGACKI